VEDNPDALGGLPRPTMNARRFNRLFHISHRGFDDRKLHIPQFANRSRGCASALCASFMCFDPGG
jgi:hypothetical protein